MKTSRLLGSLVLACLVLTASQAVAQVTVHYNDGDLFLGFRSSDGTQDYLVDIGQPDQFVNAPSGGTILITNPSSTDLATVFGADWYTRIDPNTGRNAVLWALVGGRIFAGGVDMVDNTLYSSNPTDGTWPRRSNSSQAGTTSLTDAQGTTFDGNVSTPNCPTCIIQADGSANSYASFQPGGPNSGGISYQTWNPYNEGTPAMTLTFDRILPSSTPGLPSQLLGRLTLMNNGTVLFTAGPIAQGAFSRKTHGAVGTFDVPLPLTGTVGIECRIGPTYQMIINFATSVMVQSASVTSGSGMVSSFTGSGTSTITVNLTGVTDQQRITMTLHGVNDGTHTGDVPISMGVLIGDVNGNGAVSAADVALTKSQVGATVGAGNFREDVNVNGTISSTDVALVKSDVGHALPP
ncbi:MAG: dockerin type I domain-containing protein [Chthoniobacterales bacterium]